MLSKSPPINLLLNSSQLYKQVQCCTCLIWCMQGQKGVEQELFLLPSPVPFCWCWFFQFFFLVRHRRRIKVFIGLLHIPRRSLGICFEPLSYRGKMVHNGFHASDGHRSFMKSLRLNASSPMTPRAVPWSCTRFWGPNPANMPLAVLRPKPPNPLGVA